MKKTWSHLALFTAALVIPWNASAQTDGQRALSYTTSTGDLVQVQAPNPGKVHLHGSAVLTTADYFRGLFDGVPEDGDWAFQPNLGMTVEFDEIMGRGSEMSLTVGLANGLSDEDPFDEVGSPQLWYAADAYAGLTSRLANDLMAGATYTIYTAPNDIFSSTHELALTASYAGADVIGNFSPQFKIALPVHNQSGIYVEAAIRPDIAELLGVQMPVQTFVPMRIGAGFNEYYEDEFAMYGSIGLAASVPLNVSEDYGRWSVDGSVNLLMRQDDFEEMGEPYDSANNFVFSAAVGVSFLY